MDAIEIHRWMGHDLTTWARRWGVPAVRAFRRVGSTNDVARDMADAGAPEGTLVLAEEQTRGRGRRGRAWHAPARASLSMSMVLRPPNAAAGRVITLRLGLAAARGLDPLLASRVGLKWPNDLVLDGKKVGGILCEAVALDGIGYVVAGIGLNLRRPEGGWPPDLADRATALDQAARSTLEPHVVVERLVAAWLTVAAAPATTLSDAERSEFELRDVLRGHAIALDDRPAGVALGITPAGSLRVRHHERTSELVAGTVRAMSPPLG